jgi:hypothetical protein
VFALCQIVKSDNFRWKNHPRAIPLLMSIGEEFYRLSVAKTEPQESYIKELINTWKKTKYAIKRLRKPCLTCLAGTYKTRTPR